MTDESKDSSGGTTSESGRGVPLPGSINASSDRAPTPRAGGLSEKPHGSMTYIVQKGADTLPTRRK